MSRRESGEETAAGDGLRQPTASEEASGGSAAVSSLLVSNGTDPSLPSQSQTSAASAAEHADSFATLLTTPLLPVNVLRPDTDTLNARIADTERQLQQARKLAELNRELAALSVSPKASTGARPGDNAWTTILSGAPPPSQSSDPLQHTVLYVPMADRNSEELRDFLTHKTWLTEQQIQTLTEAHMTVSALASAEARLLAENLGIQPLEAHSLGQAARDWLQAAAPVPRVAAPTRSSTDPLPGVPIYTGERGSMPLDQFLRSFERHADIEGHKDSESKGRLLLRHLGAGPMADINTWLEGEEYSKLRLQGGSVNFGHYCGVLRSAASDPRAEARAWSSARHLGDRSQARSLVELANMASQRAKARAAAGDPLSSVDLYYALLFSLTDEEYRLWIASWHCQNAGARRPPSAVAESPEELRARCDRGHKALVAFCKLHTNPLGGSRPAAAPPSASAPAVAASQSARAGSTRGGPGASSKRYPGAHGGGSSGGGGRRAPATAAAVASTATTKPAQASRASSRAPSEAGSNSESDTSDPEAEAALAAVTTDHPTPKYFGSDSTRNTKEFKRRRAYSLCFCCIAGTHRHPDYDDVYPSRRCPHHNAAAPGFTTMARCVPDSEWALKPQRTA